MTRAAAGCVREGSPLPGLATAVSLAVLACVVCLTLRASPQTGAPGDAVAPGHRVPSARQAVAPARRLDGVGRTSASQAQALAASRPAAAAASPAQPSRVPYRVLGVAVAEGTRAIVLFGRGRVITVHGPGEVDDAYEVDALFDDYLVLRHRPSGVGTVLRFGTDAAQAVRPVDPELSPHD